MMWAPWQCKGSGIGNGFIGLLHRPSPMVRQLSSTARSARRITNATRESNNRKREPGVGLELQFFTWRWGIVLTNASRSQNEAHLWVFLQGCTMEPVSSNENATTELLQVRRVWVIIIAQPCGQTVPPGAIFTGAPDSWTPVVVVVVVRVPGVSFWKLVTCLFLGGTTSPCRPDSCNYYPYRAFRPARSCNIRFRQGQSQPAISHLEKGPTPSHRPSVEVSALHVDNSSSIIHPPLLHNCSLALSYWGPSGRKTLPLALQTVTNPCCL